MRDALREGTLRLTEAGVPSPAHDARVLLVTALETSAPLVLVDEVPASFRETFAALLERRCAREPLQQILGETGFRRLTLRVKPGVFIPRPETEIAIDVVHEFAAGGESVSVAADLCTGSGTLACALADEFPQASVYAVEVAADAAALARENLELTAPGRTWQVLQADVSDPRLTSQIPTCDVVVANPPYIPAGMVPREEEVLRYDPERALYGGGEDGLEVPREVARLAAKLLREGGLFVMEHADVQGAATQAMLREETPGAFTDVKTRLDLAGRERFLVARRTANGQF
ncbi:peptide chain release factor N(5)-glutamine methyltransferase [Dermabacteraceae bacterium P7074]